MSRNRRKHTNNIQVASLVRYITIAVVLGMVGLTYVYMKNQLHTYGRRCEDLEQTKNRLAKRNDIVKSQVASWTSHAALRRRLSEGFVQLVPISENAIMRVNSDREKVSKSEIRFVLNEGSGR